MAHRVTLSIHTKLETSQKLETLARATNRTMPALVSEAIEQYVAHQEWLINEMSKGLWAADRGELIDDRDMETWFRSIGAADRRRRL